MGKTFLYTSIFFDLDGTLIDSSPSILKCFRTVLDHAGITPLIPLDSSIIGPPLRQTLMNFSGLEPGVRLEELVADFQRSYDTEGYQETIVYPGIQEMLDQLYLRAIPITIATNKRHVPTLKIVEHLGWTKYFAHIGALDMTTPPYPSKAALLGNLLEITNCAPEAALYVGDKREDGEAAAANGMPFVAARWGYGEWDNLSIAESWKLVRFPLELIQNNAVL